MEAKFRDSSKAFREILLIATAWLRYIQHSIQQQEIRLEQVELHARAHEKETNANTADIGCMQLNQELQRRRLERLEGIIHLQEQTLLAQERTLKGVREGEKKLGRELRVQNPRQKGKEPACPSGARPTAKGGREPLQVNPVKVRH